MSNNLQATGCDAPVRESSFFDKTESNYRNVETRALEARDRIDRVCDSIGGGQPREALNKADSSERHPAAFDRCNHAETSMYSSINILEEAILRLENLGLT